MADAPAQNLIPTGIEGLDEVLRGGLPERRLHLVQGGSGTGKTTLALQFCLAGLARGDETLYVSLSETPEEIRRIATSHGWSIDGLSIFYHEPSADQRELQTVLPPAEFELPAALDAVLEHIESVRPTLLVIDSLSELRLLAGEPRWYRRGLVRLRGRLEALDCTVLLLDTDLVSEVAESYLGSVLRLESCTPVYGPVRRRAQIVKMRGHDFATGYHDMRIRTGGLEVFPRLVAAERRQHFEPETLGTGLTPLDEMLGGGLDQGTAVLLLGPTGTGKSTMAMQLGIAAADRGERVLMYVFDERTQTVFQRAAGLGFRLEAHAETGTVEVRQIDAAELTPGEFADQVRRKANEDGASVVILDSLNAYLYAMPEERYLNVHLHELLAELSQQSVTSIIVGTQQMTSDGASSRFDVSYLADTVLLFTTVDLEGKRAKTVSVYKRRSGRHSNAVRELVLGPEGLSIGAHVDVPASSPEAEGFASAHKRLDRGVVDGGD